MGKRGNPQDMTEAYYIGLMSASGYRKKDMAKPVIGIVYNGPLVKTTF